MTYHSQALPITIQMAESSLRDKARHAQQLRSLRQENDNVKAAYEAESASANLYLSELQAVRQSVAEGLRREARLASSLETERNRRLRLSMAALAQTKHVEDLLRNEEEVRLDSRVGPDVSLIETCMQYEHERRAEFQRDPMIKCVDPDTGLFEVDRGTTTTVQLGSRGEPEEIIAVLESDTAAQPSGGRQVATQGGSCCIV